MRLSTLAVSAAVSLMSLPALAAIDPGHYEISGYQTICLEAGGTWYGTSFPGWGGGWRQGKPGVSIWGNYAEGAGNDALAFFPSGKGHWQEWRDDGTYEALITGVSLVPLGGECPGPALEAARRNPGQR